MSRWYRAYEGTVTDPKLAEAAMVAGCSRSVSVAAWHLHLENAATINDGGRFELPPLRIAAALCEPLAVIEALLAAFTATGIVRGSHVVAWNRRQYLGDHSAERVRKHRAKKMAETLPSNDHETLRNVSETDHRQRHRTESSEANASGEPPRLSASDITKAIFDTGVSILTATGHENRSARSIIGRWRKGFTDSEVLTVLSRCPDDVSEPVEWITASLQAERKKSTGQSNGRSTRPDHRNGIALALDRRLGLGEPTGEAGRQPDGGGQEDHERPLALAAPVR